MKRAPQQMRGIFAVLPGHSWIIRASGAARRLGAGLLLVALAAHLYVGIWSVPEQAVRPESADGWLHFPGHNRRVQMPGASTHPHVSDTFRIGTRPWTRNDFYKGLPISAFRPSGQFYIPTRDFARSSPADHPVMTIVTPTRDPRPLFFTRTVRFVLEQSLQSFRWVIVNDHSTNPTSRRQLQALQSWAQRYEPHRIMIVDNESTHGNGPSAMNYGLQFVADSTFVVILDDDDMWELTTLEKAALVMTWVPDAHAVSFDVVNHGSKEFLWKRGFYNGDESFFTENNLMQGTPFRATVLQHCRFREDMADGGADWDFWMCMADHGMWGIHVPEHGNWYQWNPPDYRSRRWGAVTSRNRLHQTRERIQKRYPKLIDVDNWPRMVLPPPFDKNPRADRKQLFENPLGRRNLSANLNQSVLLVLRDFVTDPPIGQSAVQYAREFAEAGWRVTVVLTHYSDDENATGDTMRQLMAYTHDVFVAGLVAPLHKLPDLLAYLIESRRVSIAVVLSDPCPLQITRWFVAAGLRLHDGLDAHVTSIPIAVIELCAPNEHQIGDHADAAAASLLQAPTDPASLRGRGAVWFAAQVHGRPAVGHTAEAGRCVAGRGHAAMLKTRIGSTSVPMRTPGGSTSIVNAATEATNALTDKTLPKNVGASELSTHDWITFVQHYYKMPVSIRHSDRGMDMHQIQRALQYRKKRTGFGRRMQISCPEHVYGNGKWISALETPVACEGASFEWNTSIPSLRVSARQQCGAWCLANLAERGRHDERSLLPQMLGWEFTGACFRVIKSTSNRSKCSNQIQLMI